MHPEAQRKMIHSSQAHEEGQSLVEFSLILPLMLLLIMGIIQGGLLFNNWIVLTDAVRAGARELSISRLPDTDACTAAGNRVKGAALNLDGTKILLSYSVTNACTDLVEGTNATVTATYPCSLIILGYDYIPGCSLTSRTTVRVE